jgi:hypothetical protein
VHIAFAMKRPRTTGCAFGSMTSCMPTSGLHRDLP